MLFHTSSRRMGGGSSRRDPSLSMTLVAPPLASEGVVHRPSPSVTRGFPVPCVVARVSRFRQFRALSQPFTQSLPCRTWFRRPLVKFSMFLKNFSKTVEPAELRPPLWVVTFVLRDLTRDLYIPFWSSDECFLPSHSSSCWSLPRLS